MPRRSNVVQSPTTMSTNSTTQQRVRNISPQSGVVRRSLRLARGRRRNSIPAQIVLSANSSITSSPLVDNLSLPKRVTSIAANQCLVATETKIIIKRETLKVCETALLSSCVAYATSSTSSLLRFIQRDTSSTVEKTQQQQLDLQPCTKAGANKQRIVQGRTQRSLSSQRLRKTDSEHGHVVETVQNPVHHISSDDRLTAALEANYAQTAVEKSSLENLGVPLFEYARNFLVKGLVVIFNHYHFARELGLKERQASLNDAKSLQQVFSLYGFQTLVFDNLKMRDLKNTLHKLATCEQIQLEHVESFVCIMLSHGAKDDLVYAYDAALPVRALAEPFSIVNCPALADKPKIFIIQACRGAETDSGVLLAHVDDAESLFGRAKDEADSPFASSDCGSVGGLSQEADFLFAFSTPAGYLSFKNSERGSYFITFLCDLMRDLHKQFNKLRQQLAQITAARNQHATRNARKRLEAFHSRYDIVWLLRCVSRQLGFRFISNCAEQELCEKKQVPCIVSTLRADFWLLPSVEEEKL